MSRALKIIEGFVRGVTQSGFEVNIEKQDAVIRRLAIIGEAIKNIPDDIRAKYPNVPWRDAAGLRGVVVHEYFGVSLEIIWNVAVRELPALKEQIRQIQKEQRP